MAVTAWAVSVAAGLVAAGLSWQTATITAAVSISVAELLYHGLKRRRHRRRTSGALTPGPGEPVTAEESPKLTQLLSELAARYDLGDIEVRWAEFEGAQRSRLGAAERWPGGGRIWLSNSMFAFLGRDSGAVLRTAAHEVSHLIAGDAVYSRLRKVTAMAAPFAVAAVFSGVFSTLAGGSPFFGVIGVVAAVAVIAAVAGLYPHRWMIPGQAERLAVWNAEVERRREADAAALLGRGEVVSGVAETLSSLDPAANYHILREWVADRPGGVYYSMCDWMVASTGDSSFSHPGSVAWVEFLGGLVDPDKSSGD